jgi:sensor histidine kinase YesM
LNTFASYFDGLTPRRIAWATGLALVAALVSKLVADNTYLDLLVSALCMAYTITLLYTVFGNLRALKVRREVLQGFAVILGSLLGVVLIGVVKGRDLVVMFTEKLSGVMLTMSIGIGFGAIAVAGALLRERQAQERARLHEAEAARQRLEKNVLHAQLQLMQAQVEPHFLFNTLANVQHLVETDPASASHMLESLIQYLRAAMPQMREESTNLGRETDMARAFLEIHKMRMGSRLSFAVDVPENLRCRTFPPMMLISLVENAVKHGVDPCCDAGSITIRARAEGGRLRVSVADTGEGISPKKGTGVGLSNIRERLKTFYGSAARLTLEENAPHGVVSMIEIDDNPAVATAAS